MLNRLLLVVLLAACARNYAAKDPIDIMAKIPPIDVLDDQMRTVAASTDRPAFGILYIAYIHASKHPSKLIKFLRLAVRSARTFREMSPQLNIAIATSNISAVYELDTTHVFTHLVAIPPDLILPGYQFLTRLLTLGLSPFITTLELDSDTVACSDLHKVAIPEINLQPFDFAVHRRAFGNTPQVMVPFAYTHFPHIMM